MIKKVLRTLVSVIGLGIVISNPTTNYGEDNVSSNMMTSCVEEKEIVSLRTISREERNTVEEKNSKATNSIVKYMSLEEVKDVTNKDMDLSKPSGLSRKDFVKLIQNLDYDYTGVFARNARYIWKLAHKYQFNEIFFMAIIANESLWGASELAIKNNNYTSQMEIIEKEEIAEDGKAKMVYKQKMKWYPSEKECFRKTARNIGRNYLTEGGEYYQGKTIYDINENYCEPGEHEDGSPYKYMWADDTYRCMEMILGK